jgi:hypothetical protein
VTLGPNGTWGVISVSYAGAGAVLQPPGQYRDGVVELKGEQRWCLAGCSLIGSQTYETGWSSLEERDTMGSAKGHSVLQPE